MSLADLLCNIGIVYVKESLGQGGKSIGVYKIRTMVPDADKGLEGALNSVHDKYGHPVNDSRITWWGEQLRKYFINELPQLYNLIRGDIKLVGVRPMREMDWKRYPPELKEEALKQKPGFFGVHLAYKGDGDFNTHVRVLQQYLERRRQNPVRTDIHYLWQVLINISIHGIRGS